MGRCRLEFSGIRLAWIFSVTLGNSSMMSNLEPIPNKLYLSTNTIDHGYGIDSSATKNRLRTSVLLRVMIEDYNGEQMSDLIFFVHDCHP